MGTVHKFRPPPKNKGQFKGPKLTGFASHQHGRRRRRHMRPWQKTLLAWLLLVAIAAGIWGLRALVAAPV